MNENRRHHLNQFYKKNLASFLEHVDPNKISKWNIYAEDANCDLGGPHSNAYIGDYVGTFEEAAEHATSMKNFYTWGGGGYIQEAENQENVFDKKKLPTAAEAREIVKKNLQVKIDQELAWITEKIYEKLKIDAHELGIVIKFYENVQTLTEKGYALQSVNAKNLEYNVSWK